MPTYPEIVAVGHLCMDKLHICERMPQENLRIFSLIRSSPAARPVRLLLLRAGSVQQLDI